MTTETTVNTHCAPTNAHLMRCVSILPNDYTNLENQPSINGETLVGNKSAKELGILSILPENYEPVDIHNAAAKNGGIVIVGDDNSPMILSAQSILDRGTGFFTSEEIDGDVEIGVYQFVQKK